MINEIEWPTSQKSSIYLIGESKRLNGTQECIR